MKKNWKISADLEGRHVVKAFATEHEAEEFGYMLYGRGYENVEIRKIN